MPYNIHMGKADQADGKKRVHYEISQRFKLYTYN